MSKNIQKVLTLTIVILFSCKTTKVQKFKPITDMPDIGFQKVNDAHIRFDTTTCRIIIDSLK